MLAVMKYYMMHATAFLHVSWQLQFVGVVYNQDSASYLMLRLVIFFLNDYSLCVLGSEFRYLLYTGVLSDLGAVAAVRTLSL